MCGIAGFWNRNGKGAGGAELDRMLERLRHRGPDHQGRWTDGQVFLGHTRLSIIDTSDRGHQPILTPDGNGVLVYNGEVYNYPDLRVELEKNGVVFSSRTDSEVVLQALHQWGPERAVPRFDGMFAFAYLDRRSGALWFARDRLGIKPLYMARRGGELIFASEIKGVLAHPAVQAVPNVQALVAHVMTQKLEPDVVPFEGISSLSAGSLLKVDSEGERPVQYFDVARDLDVRRLVEDSLSAEEWVARTREALAASVRSHLASDVPLASMCSGGLDSSLITAHARDDAPNITGYVAAVEGDDEEVERARLFSRHTGIPIREVAVTGADYMRLWPEAIRHIEYPTVFVNDVPFLALARAIRRDGVKVALSGEGADELFGGYAWQVGAGRKWRLLGWLVGHTRPGRLEWALDRVARGARMVASWTRSSSPFWRVEGNRYFNAAYLAALDGGHRLGRQAMLFEKLACVRSPFERAFLARCLDDLHGHLYNLLIRGDRLGMAASLETRVPFLSDRMIELALHMPARMKYAGGMGKWVLRQVAEQRLPSALTRAPKIGFRVPKGMWTPGRRILEDGVIGDLFHWDRRYRDKIRGETQEHLDLLLALIGIEIWARLFLRNESAESIAERLR